VKISREISSVHGGRKSPHRSKCSLAVRSGVPSNQVLVLVLKLRA